MLIIQYRVQVVEIQGMVTCRIQGFGFQVPERGQGVVEAGDFKAEGGINVHRNVQLFGDVQPVHLVDEFLGSAKCESRDKDLAGVGQAAGQDLTEAFGAVGSVAVEPVAVG